jgi:pilus assembly protein Flp/PilA
MASNFAFHGHVLLFDPTEKALMVRFRRFLVEFLQHEDGPTAVEYAVMLALIVVVCIGAITTLGGNANTTFSTVGSAVATAGP